MRRALGCAGTELGPPGYLPSRSPRRWAASSGCSPSSARGHPPRAVLRSAHLQRVERHRAELTPSGPPDLVLEGRFERVQERRYTHLPFDVPGGVRQIHLRYSYSDQIDSDPTISGGNTLDIGVFDERGIAEASPGVRGWSGSNKIEITIDERWATPPYRKGWIGAGRWHVLLGPYKVGPRGCDWKVEIWFDAEVRAPWHFAGAARRVNPDPLPKARPGWMRADLHCHTVYSDGDGWPQEMLLRAADAGLDILGVTDHNNVAHRLAYGPGGDGLPIVVPGVEVTTYGGHWNAWGTDRWWEFRQPDAKVVERAIRAAVDAGALVSVCHPKPLGPPWEYEGVSGFHAVEAWNSDWTKLNSASLAFWEERLRRGERVVLVGGSDTHYLRRRDPDPRHSQKLGTPTTWVRADPNVDAILAALRKGHAFVSESPRGPQLYLEADRVRAGRVSVEVRDGQGATLQILSDAGSVASATVAAAGWDGTFAVPASARYVRAQLVSLTGEVRALSNPVWADRLYQPAREAALRTRGSSVASTSMPSRANARASAG